MGINSRLYNILMYLIIGLGNPGEEYKKTRHNVGFQCLDILREKLDFSPWKLEQKFSALLTGGLWKSRKIMLAKPQNFMNASGKVVQKIYSFYKKTPHDLWIIYDDIDLPFGKIRIRRSGSAGSHNGMKSVISCLGFQNFPRLRIGIESRGVSASKNQDINSFVLHPFLKKEEPLIKNSLENAANALLVSLEFGIAKAMDTYNI